MAGVSPEHAEALKASAISDEVALARGYRTATKRAELADLGFARYQQNVPALVVPVWGVDGEVVNYQARPDTPRIHPETGKLVKYETVAGSVVRLDVPPPCRARIGSPHSHLWVTEGVKKADALASAGACVIGLLGVDCFKCEDWKRVSLDGRQVHVVYDSDVMVKRSVHGALERIAKYLGARGAEVRFVYLPADDGKVGVDDYLAAGHTIEDLYALAQDELRELPPEPEPERPAALPACYLLAVIENLYRRYVRFPSDHEPVALALFTMHTHALDAAQSTPYVLAVSPEKRSGKTRVLEVAELVAREPIRSANITAAGVFQAIEAWTPTLLIDELDTVLVSKSEQAEYLRGVLNAGNRRGSHVIRGTPEGVPQRFPTFCPKLLAGINTGKLPDTIRDRSIVLDMRRRKPGETVADLFPSELADELAELHRMLGDWAAENTAGLAGWRRPGRVDGLDDRLQEAWDPLLAIADLAGEGWPEKARRAATALAGAAEDTSEAAHGHVLIEALRGIFGEDQALASKAICQALNAADEELPFARYSNGAGIAPRDLATLLKPYGIKSKDVWTGSKSVKGYRAGQFAEAWERYAPRADPSGEGREGRGPREPNNDGGFQGRGDPRGKREESNHRGSLADSLADKNPDKHGDLADLADLAPNRTPPRGARVSSNGTGPPTMDPRLRPLPGETYEQWERRVEAMFPKPS